MSKPTFEGLVDLNHIQLFVRQFGQSGPDIIVIHGGPDWDHSYLLPITQYLEKISKLTFFDIRGCGRSDCPELIADLTKDAIVEDIASLMKNLNISQAIILGLSFGGRVAIKFSGKYPYFVQSLIDAGVTLLLLQDYLFLT